MNADTPSPPPPSDVPAAPPAGPPPAPPAAPLGTPRATTRPSGSPFGAPRWGLVLFGALVLLAALSWLLQYRIESRPASPEDWENVWPAIDGEFQPGDGLAIYPPAAAYDGPRVAALLAKAGTSHDLAFLHPQPATELDRARHARVWIAAPWGDEPLEDWPGAQSVAESGSLGLWRWDRAHPAPSFDALASLKDATVSRIHANGRANECRYVGGRHRCDGRWWTAIFDTIAEVGDTRRRVVFAHAHPPGATVTVSYPAAALGAQLFGGVGLTLAAVRRDVGSDVTFRVFVGGEEKYTVSLPRGDFGWHTFAIDTSAWASAPTEVRFEIWAEQTDGRQVAFDAASW